MRALEELGIYQAGASALQHSGGCQVSGEEFFEKANDLLAKLDVRVVEDYVPNLVNEYGRWHPSGFMVYPVGIHRELGALRFHIWPKDLRQKELKGLGQLASEGICDGDIHNHAWHIASKVVGGIYSDNFYKVEAQNLSTEVVDDRLISSSGLWHVFRVRYRSPANPEALVASGSVVSAEVESSRSMARGEFHTIEAGPFHAPTIQDDRLCATLVFNSHRVIDAGPDILVRGSSKPIVGNRLDVSIEEAVLAVEQLG